MMGRTVIIIPAFPHRNLLLGLAAFCILGCGGSKDGQNLTVDPSQPSVLVGETLVLNATPRTDLQSDVEWEVKEAYGGGLLQSQGLRVTYVAPEMAGTYHVLLTATASGGRSVREQVEVRALPNPSIEPSLPRLAPGGTLHFRARMKGLARDTATWSVEEPAGGEVTQDGRYTAPGHPGVFHVVATSVLDPGAAARVTVTVGEP